MLNFIDKWYDKIKPFLFKYKDGFFELPYLGSSPILMIESFRRMPFIKHDESIRSIDSASPFVDAKVYYHQISDEIIIINSALIIKSNVCFRAAQKKELKNEFYTLTLSTNLESDNPSKRIIKGEHLENSTFQFLNQGINVDTYHFKNSHFKSFSLYFKKSWIDNYINENIDKCEKLIKLLHTGNEYVISNINNIELVNNFISKVEEEFKIEYIRRDLEKINTFVAEFLDMYLNFGLEATNSVLNYHLSNNDRIKIKELEGILYEHIYSKFPGIDYLAKHAGFSETKLKYLFKTIHNKTLLEYFQEIQMKAAYEMLSNSDVKVSDVAQKFGYSNAGKFTARFKQQMNILPSEIYSKESSRLPKNQSITE